MIFASQHPFPINRVYNNNPCTNKNSPSNTNKSATKSSDADNKKAGFYNIKKQAKQPRIVMERKPIHHEENSEAATISLDVAGFATEDVSIHAEDDVLYVSAERKNKLGDVFVIQRKFRLDCKTADEENMSASVTDGVLEIVVAKKKHSGRREIPISSFEKTPSSTCSANEENPVVSTTSVSQKTDDDDEALTTKSERLDLADEAIHGEEQQQEQEREREQVKVETVSAGNKVLTEVETETWEEVLE